jgi:hypothetical protein
MAKALNQAIEPITCRAGLIAERQMAVFASKLSDELSRRGFGIADFAEISDLAVPAGVGNGYGIA